MFLIMLIGVLKYFSVHLIRNAHEKKKKKKCTCGGTKVFKRKTSRGPRKEGGIVKAF